jgi:hypothetical protein
MKTYALRIIGKTGMYTTGNWAASPELAKLDKGVLIASPSDRLGVVEREELPGTWSDSAGNRHKRYADAVLVAAETTPGEWAIA